MSTETFIRTRIIIQILITLISFIGFNEAMLAVRYRNSTHLSNLDARRANTGQGTDKPLTIDYGNSCYVAPLTYDPDNIYLNKPPLRLIDSPLKETDDGAGKVDYEKPADFIPGIDGICTYEAMHF